MSQPGTPLPPPPPPGPTPPPGMVGYEARPWTAGPLDRVGGVAKFLVVLLAVYAVAALADLAMTPLKISAAEDFRAGDLSEDDYTGRQLGVNSFSLISGLITIGIVVLTIIWLYRIARNHRAVGRRTTWAPGWAIGGWFLPPLLYVIPLLVLRESWKAAEPTSPPGDESWRRAAEPVVLWVWFVLYSLVPVVLLVLGASSFMGGGGFGDSEDIAQQVIDSEWQTYVGGVAALLSAGAWALVVRGLTSRHVALTGEPGAR